MLLGLLESCTEVSHSQAGVLSWRRIEDWIPEVSIKGVDGKSVVSNKQVEQKALSRAASSMVSKRQCQLLVMVVCSRLTLIRQRLASLAASNSVLPVKNEWLRSRGQRVRTSKTRNLR